MADLLAAERVAKLDAELRKQKRLYVISAGAFLLHLARVIHGGSADPVESLDRAKVFLNEAEARGFDINADF